MQEHPNLKLFSNLMDAHFYIFEKWVVDFIAQDDSFSALKGEVLPYLVKKQFSKVNISKKKEEEDEDKKKVSFHGKKMIIFNPKNLVLEIFDCLKMKARA